MYPQALPRITPTSIGDLDCEKKFHTLRVLKQWPDRQNHENRGQGTPVPNNAPGNIPADGHPTPPAANPIEFGIALHDVLRNVYHPRHQVRPCLTHVEPWARAAFFARRYSSEDQRRADTARAVRMVRGYADQDDPEDAAGTIAVEYEAEFPHYLDRQPLFALFAKLDRVIVRSARRLVVRDYKCGRARVNLQEAFVTLWVAKLALPDYDEYALELDWIHDDEPVDRRVVEAADLRGLFDMVREKAIRVLTATEHPAEPGEACSFCPLRPTCLPHAQVALEGDVFGD